MPLFAAAAEPPPYDMAATPEATTVRQHALNRCRAAPSRTMREQIDCSLAAHRAYAVGTRLRDMGLFRDYAKTLRQAADDADAGRITPYEAQNRIVRAGVKFARRSRMRIRIGTAARCRMDRFMTAPLFPQRSRRAMRRLQLAVAGRPPSRRTSPVSARPSAPLPLRFGWPIWMFITVTTPSSPTPPPTPWMAA
jgi:hypothetical protein